MYVNVSEVETYKDQPSNLEVDLKHSCTSQATRQILK